MTYFAPSYAAPMMGYGGMGRGYGGGGGFRFFGGGRGGSRGC